MVSKVRHALYTPARLIAEVMRRLSNSLFALRHVWKMILLATLALLTACTTTQQMMVPDAVQFARSGRFVVQVQGVDNAQAVSGGFDWQSYGAGVWQLSLRSPLGAVLARLNASPGQVVLERPGEMPQRADRASDLLRALFAAQVPVDAMVDWIEGKAPANGQARVVARHAQGQIEVLEQSGWTIRLERYDALGPRLIEITGRDDGRDVTVRLVVDSQ